MKGQRTFKSLAELQAAIASGEVSGNVHCAVLHDDWCAMPAAACNCSPEFVVEGLTAESYERGANAEAEWVRSRTC